MCACGPFPTQTLVVPLISFLLKKKIFYLYFIIFHFYICCENILETIQNFSYFFLCNFLFLINSSINELPVRVQPSDWKLGMSCKTRHYGFNPHSRSFLGLPDTWFWWVGSCIHSLLPKDGSKGSYLSEIPRRQNLFYYIVILT